MLSNYIKNIQNINWSDNFGKCKNSVINRAYQIKNFVLYLFELIAYYSPIVWTKIIEFSTFTIPILSHFAPIQIARNDYVLITSTDMGSYGRKLIGVFYKRYSPYDIRDFTNLMDKYLQVNSLKFNVFKFSTNGVNDECKKYTVEILANGIVKVDNKFVELQLYNIDLNAILADDVPIHQSNNSIIGNYSNVIKTRNTGIIGDKCVCEASIAEKKDN